MSQRIVEGMEVLKNEQLELIDQLSVVKIWIQLNIPKIEDGGNFGVSIQVREPCAYLRFDHLAFHLL